jgi:TP901 family phage tail tape measure protein
LSRIEFNIVALGDFSSINAQLKSFQAQVQLLQKNLSGVGLNSSLQKDLGSLNASFKQTLLSTGQFTESTVRMSSETARFGEALVTGKLKLSEYYGIITQKSTQAVAQVKALALEQTKLQNSMVVSDPSRQGILSVYTPSKIDKVANATKIVANEQNLYNIAVAKGSQELINWGKNTQWAGRQLTVGMSVPLMIFGQEAVSAFKDVNIELTRLQRLYGEGLTPPSQAEIDKISGQVINLGKEIAGTMGIAQTETVKAAANFAAMGRQGKDLLDITAQTMRLSKLGAVSTADATNTVVALQNVYKVNTYDLADAVNFLSDIQKQTTMTLGDMTQAIPRVGPIMQQLGGTYKDTAVMLVAMREAGIPAAQAANAIKSAVASMIAPTKSASAEFQKYGISLTGIKTSTQGNPVKMIEALQAGMSKLSPLVKEQLIEKLFGKFQFARVSALLENFGKTGSQTVNAIKIAGATSGELATLANQEMKQATESPTAKFQRSLESFKANLLPIGQKIVEFTTKLMDFANAISKIFSGLPGPIKTVMGAVAVGVALSGPVIMLTGLIANFVGYLVKGMFNLKQLATGGKTLGQLLTPELIAAQNASKIFSSGLADDVTAIDLLSTAIQDLTLNLKEMAAALSMSTNVSGLSQKISGITKTEEMLFSQPHLPGFASGGFVPGNGNSDTFPAMLTPGEAVIPKDKAAKHAKFINAMINGTLPGYARGLGIGSDRISENSDPNSLAGTGGFGGRVGRSLLKKTSWSSMELEKQAAKEALSNTG